MWTKIYNTLFWISWFNWFKFCILQHIIDIKITAYGYVQPHRETVHHLTCYESYGSMKCTENTGGIPVYDSVRDNKIDKLSKQLKELNDDSKIPMKINN